MRGIHRIVFNTGITYAKAVVTALVSLYVTRIVLQALGAVDFGLYNVVGGVIAMLAFLNAAMTTSTQRFISFHLGKKNLEDVKKIFANSILIHFIIGILIVVIVEIIGIYLINHKLQIDPNRLDIAKYILHFTVASTFITIISVPYDAVINAHENMTFLAIVSILESIFRLGAAFLILIIPGDRLFYYGLLMMVISVIIRIIKRYYSKTRYKECDVEVKRYYDSGSIKELTSFASWNLFGTLCALGRNQGVAIVLNLFYSTVINAAYGVANQLNGQLMFFSQTMMSAMRPQIMKSEGANDRARMIKLSLSANRFAFFLFTFFALPMFVQMPFILTLWLKNVPQFSVEFCRAILLLTMANQINMGLMTAVQAIGRIKVYQMVAGGIQLLTLPIGFVLLKLGYPPFSIILGSFVLECISTVFRMFYFRYLTGYPVLKYFTEVILRSLLTMVPAAMIMFFFFSKIEFNWPNLIIVFITSSIIYGTSIFIYGLNNREKDILKDIISKIKYRLK